MKSALIMTSLFFSSLAMAETATYNISGMHCGGCKAAIEGSVCKGLADTATTCTVEQIDEKKQTGKLTLITKDGVAVDDAKVMALMSKAGEYKAVRAKAKK